MKNLKNLYVQRQKNSRGDSSKRREAALQATSEDPS